MRLTPEEYRRGVISWDCTDPVAVSTRTNVVPGEADGWSEWLTEPTGSVVQSAPNRVRQLSIKMITEGALVPPHQLRWEQEMDDEVVTWVYDRLEDPPNFLRRVLCNGFSHRLVIATAALSWSEDFILREDGLLIRFVEGRLVGEKTDPVSQVEVDDEGQVTLTSAPMGEYVANGRFIEIIISGDSADDAESRAYTTLGLVGLCLGDQAVGDVIFSEPYEIRDGRQFGALSAGVTAKIPRLADDREKEILEELLSGLLRNDKIARAIRIGLSWYERGLRATTPLERFFSFLVGLEVLVKSYTSEHGPTPETSERELAFEAIRAKVSGILNEDDVKRLAEKFIEPSFGDRARFYTTMRGWDLEIDIEIRQLYSLRNQAVHGDPVVIGAQEARRAHEICAKSLKAELGVTEEFLWEHEPKLLGLSIEYELLRSAT